MKPLMFVLTVAFSFNLNAQTEWNIIPVPVKATGTNRIYCTSLTPIFINQYQKTSPGQLKNAQLTKQKLDNIQYYKKVDSVSHLIYYKLHEFTYDERGREIVDIESIKNENNSQFYLTGKTEKSYDTNDNLVQVIKYKKNNTWIRDSLRELSYDTLHNVIEDISYYWNGSAWSRYLMKKKEYNQNSQRTLMEKYMWDDSEHKWVGDTLHGYNEHYLGSYPKIEYTYFSNGLRKDSYIYMWDFEESEWVKKYKTLGQEINNTRLKYRDYFFRNDEWKSTNYFFVDLVYNNNCIINYKMESYEDSTGIYWKFNMHIDTLCNLLNFEAQDKIDDHWIVSYRRIRHYNNNSDIISDEFYNNSNLVPNEVWGYGSFNREYSYDQNRDMVQYTFNEWDMDNANWTETIRHAYTFDTNDTITDVLVSEEFNNITSEFTITSFGLVYKPIHLLRHKILNHDTYTLNDSTNRWDLTERLVFNYSTTEVTSVGKNNNSLSATVYPNPVDDILNIELTKNGEYTILLYDITGNAILEKRISGTYTGINISSFKSGIYFLKIINTKDHTFKDLKFIKK